MLLRSLVLDHSCIICAASFDLPRGAVTPKSIFTVDFHWKVYKKEKTERKKKCVCLEGDFVYASLVVSLLLC